MTLYLKMSRCFLAYCLLVFLLVYAEVIHCKVHYIRPTLDSLCPQNASSCLTLLQFTTNFTGTDNKAGNMSDSLLFLPGNHCLNEELYLAHGHNLSMSKYEQIVSVECTCQLGRFVINGATSVSIQGLNFIGCGSNEVSRVSLLTIVDSTFEGVENKSTVLVLNDIVNVKVVRSHFLSNTLEYYNNSSMNYSSLFDDNELLDYVYYQVTPIGPGVVYIAFSNVSIVSCRFMYNRADIGGALVAYNSSLHIDNSSFSNNRAIIGGVMVTMGSMINIYDSNFSQNLAEHHGGVMASHNDGFSIISTTFIQNFAGNKGGVIFTLGSSSFNLNSSVFKSNNASYGGVIGAIHCSTRTNIDRKFITTYKNSSFTINNTTFTSNSASFGGVMTTFIDSFMINRSTFTYNGAGRGSVMYTSKLPGLQFMFLNRRFVYNNIRSLLTINKSTFTYNSASWGGVMFTKGNSLLTISNSTFTSNSADFGGVIYSYDYHTSFTISKSNFTSNNARYGGVVAATTYFSFTISDSTFISNSASCSGGAIKTGDQSLVISIIEVYDIRKIASFVISSSSFTSNKAHFGGVITICKHCTISVIDSTFTSNSATRGGVVAISGARYFTNLTTISACDNGGIKSPSHSYVTVSRCTFDSNRANSGGVMESYADGIFFTNNIFVKNTATSIGGVISSFCSRAFDIFNSTFSLNVVTNKKGQGMIFISQSSLHIANTTFDHNVGSIYVFHSNLTCSGYLKFEKFTKVLTASNESIEQEGGVITSIKSRVIFNTQSRTHFSNNRARKGGAILAIESKIIMYGKTTISNNNNLMNTTAKRSGGGIYLKQSRIDIEGVCYLVNNSAVRGGGLYASNSTIAINRNFFFSYRHTVEYPRGTLQFINNYAKFGGGIYLEANSTLTMYDYRLEIQKKSCTISPIIFLSFVGNHANYGGAVFVADDTNSEKCSPNNECFMNILCVLFSQNSAAEQGSNLFGGLMDRCTLPKVKLNEYKFLKQPIISDVNFLQIIINNTSLDSISSRPIRLCFCNSEHKPNCSYKPPTVRVKKGEAFNLSLVAVNQVNVSVDANITASISLPGGSLGEGQHNQHSGRKCKDLSYAVFSPYESETINLFADGPCGSAILSTSHVIIQFKDCTCPVGFEPLSNSKSSTKCECICDSKLLPYISKTSCNSAISSVFRVDTNVWITYINDADSPGYIKYPNCPFDYCLPLTENVSINFNLPYGADMQCAYNRTGALCGSCGKKFSISLASSRCFPCQSHWPAVFALILLASMIAGVLLVMALLALNVTVSVGLINGFIFYANIVSAGKAVFFPSSEPSFPSVFVAWINLDIGIDVCFVDGLDAYIKTWLQLAFPIYIITLVVIVIKVSKYSPRFVQLIGRRDPISTLATLVLLSYAKLLSVTISALSYATLDYPDGKRETVWLPDGNVKYFQGKHIALVLVALLIVLIGLPYTIILFSWQWIVRASKWKYFNWTRNTRLYTFIATYHVPYKSECRFWTGLLLVVRVALYVTASVTVSSSPQTYPLISGILIGGLALFKGMFDFRIYNKPLVHVINTLLYTNLLALVLFSQFEFKRNPKKQTVVAYTSTIVTLILFIISMCYHVSLLIKKKKLPEDLNEYLLAPLTNNEVPCPITYSCVDAPKHDQNQQAKNENEPENN